jgi:hypothetical protein
VLEGSAGRLAVDLDGSGAGERLEIDIDGSGDVRYHGEPELTQRVDGSGEVTRAD